MPDQLCEARLGALHRAGLHHDRYQIFIPDEQTLTEITYKK